MRFQGPFQGRGRFASGVAAGAGATALVGSVLFLQPSGATEGAAHDTTDGGKVVAEAVPTGLADGAQDVVSAGDAGAFNVQRVGRTLTIVGVAPNAGWTFEVLANDAEAVKVAFTSAERMVFAAASLDDDGTVDAAVIDKALPAPPPPPPPAPEPQPVAAEQVKAKAASADADGDHRWKDGWCDDDGDGRDDRFEGAAFRGDGDDDHHGDHDGDRWDGRKGDGDRDHDGDGRDGHDGRKRHRRR